MKITTVPYRKWSLPSEAWIKIIQLLNCAAISKKKNLYKKDGDTQMVFGHVL